MKSRERGKEVRIGREGADQLMGGSRSGGEGD